MSSATKTLGLLAYFSTNQPEIGLTQLCRMAGRDKATTYRHLQALEDAGFVEQNPLNKRYRLGPALLQLARTREATVPRKAGAEAVLARLAEATGETAHASVLSGQTVYALAWCESPQHGTRAVIDIETFPLHATASGLCTLAFGPAQLLDLAAEDMRAFTPGTVTTRSALERAVQQAKETGFGRSDRSFEAEIYSLSAPVFDHTGHFAGTVSVASVATRITQTLERAIRENLITAAQDLTHNWGGVVPPALLTTWARTMADPAFLIPASEPEMEPAR